LNPLPPALSGNSILASNFRILGWVWVFSILGNPGAVRQDNAIFLGESLFQGQKSSFAQKYRIIPTNNPWVSKDGHFVELHNV